MGNGPSQISFAPGETRSRDRLAFLRSSHIRLPASGKSLDAIILGLHLRLRRGLSILSQSHLPDERHLIPAVRHFCYDLNPGSGNREYEHRAQTHEHTD